MRGEGFLAHRPDALPVSQEGGFGVAVGLMNVKTVDEQPRKQQRQQACHQYDGDHFLHNFIPFPGESNLLVFVFAWDFRSVWVKILVLIPFFALPPRRTLPRQVMTTPVNRAP
ncbi:MULTISPECIES: hypothetical protein [Serratia]|uniref:hypothetical protein n=1 Tax=Serratia TaxID=613 RepID=UPI0013C36E3F|nr:MULTISPECIES: hypothetical protein [Serratia]NMU41226.1 hypothetical protein [Serratia marcescens]QQU65521.1 hypothetical protein I6I46_12505 [Serratia ureilytica]